jgi:hypothetical protein
MNKVYFLELLFWLNLALLLAVVKQILFSGKLKGYVLMKESFGFK